MSPTYSTSTATIQIDADEPEPDGSTPIQIMLSTDFGSELSVLYFRVCTPLFPPWHLGQKLLAAVPISKVKALDEERRGAKPRKP